MKNIFVGFGGYHDCTRSRYYVHPLIDGISENLWKRICKETCEAKPMLGHDGSEVFVDYDSYKVFRKIGTQFIAIANITEVA